MRYLVVVLLLLPLFAGADLPVTGHGCTPPLRPDDGVDEQTWGEFLADVDGYRACISEFTDSNHQAADAHRATANAATQHWNEFVRDSLNVSEDFPWPPE
ncbi:MAG: hypothetical protein O7E57_08770 [Gammaproteobacteria bacterium]|nr:hypothetical protein [Gammaproteobacteria bacterium]